MLRSSLLLFNASFVNLYSISRNKFSLFVMLYSFLNGSYSAALILTGTHKFPLSCIDPALILRFLPLPRNLLFFFGIFVALFEGFDWNNIIFEVNNYCFLIKDQLETAAAEYILNKAIRNHYFAWMFNMLQCNRYIMFVTLSTCKWYYA